MFVVNPPAIKFCPKVMIPLIQQSERTTGQEQPESHIDHIFHAGEDPGDPGALRIFLRIHYSLSRRVIRISSDAYCAGTCFHI